MENGRGGAFLLRAVVCFALLPAIVVLAHKPKGKRGNADESGLDGSDPDGLPADLSLASLRVAAMDTLYQLDLSNDQLVALREAARGAAAEDPDVSLGPNKSLATVLAKLQSALELGTDDAAIASMRNQVVEMVNAQGVDLDDVVRPTAAAHAAAAKAMDLLKSSQLAAFIAAHADEVGDPAELMNNGLASMREAKAATQATAEAEEADEIAAETSSNVAWLVAGMDPVKAASIAQSVKQWMKTNAQAGDAEFATAESKRDADLRQIIGSIGPDQVLAHWMQEQIAVLLSNPQTIRAINLMLDHHKN